MHTPDATTNPVLIGAVASREYNRRDGGAGVARSVTVIDQETGATAEYDVADALNGELDSALHTVVRLGLSCRRYWNDTPNGRRPVTVVKAVAVLPAAA